MRIVRILKAILIINLFLLAFHFFTPTILASPDMEIEVLPPQPVSQQNFTISVYNPTLANVTPYLTDVVIRFQQTNYTITDILPNRELVLTAPQVNIPTQYTIEAYKEGYNDTNKTITIMPDSADPAHIIITVINDTIIANSYFNLRITDEYNTPIQNATVSIQNHNDKDSDGLTNESGYIRLRAPNKQEIQILAQKEGYQDDTTTIWVETTQDSFTQFLTDPFTPILIAILILIGSILYVSLKNKNLLPSSIPSQITSKKEGNTQTKEAYHHDSIKPIKKENRKTLRDFQKINHSTLSPKIEEINIAKPRSRKDIIHLDHKPQNTSSQKPIKQHHQWFSEKETIDEKVDELLSKKAPKETKDDWFKGTDSLKNRIDSTITQKQKKKNSTS